MYSLFKKEVIQFFGSLMGYFIVVVFLSITGLFLWVFPGVYNIPGGGYATLEGLFELAPWVYLFLIPAVSMRIFADEKRGGTMELLLSRPISELGLVLSKYMAALVVVMLSLLPTLLYYWAVSSLGSPAGNIDGGAVLGSYIGLFFLASIYLSIGLFASSLTGNQIVAFTIALVLSFFWYVGFGYASELPVLSRVPDAISAIGIDEHYESVSRGVLDLRDFAYFILTCGFFLLLTKVSLEWGRKPLRRGVSQVLVYVVLSALVMSVLSSLFFRVDFTSEKRYSLSPQSREVLSQMKEPALVKVYLDGELQPGFRKLKKAIKEKLSDFNAFSGPGVYVKFIDPYEEVRPERREEYFDSLLSNGLRATNVHLRTDKGTSVKLIFPSATVSMGEHRVVLNFLKNNPALGGAENINHSIETLEYEFANALKMLIVNKRERVAFLTGHGELDQWQVEDLSHALSGSFETVRISTEELSLYPDSFKLLVVAGPENRFSEKDKFAIDQYIMKGGRVLWAIASVNVSLDSLSQGMSTLAFPRDLNLEDQLFRYGARVNYDLIQDTECLTIPMHTDLSGAPSELTPMPWYFSPIVLPSQSHPVGRNIKHLMSGFVSSIDVVGDNDNVNATVLLATSPYSRRNKVPMTVSLAMANAPPSRSMFRERHIPLAVLLEGEFISVFKNRMVEAFGVDRGTEVIEESEKTKMLIVSNGSMLANKVQRRGDEAQVLPLGYDRFSRYTFGNKEFFVNAIHYLCDDSGLMSLRSRVMKLRMLDKVKLGESKVKWQVINMIVPVLVIIAAGLIFNFIRKSRYARRSV